MIITKKSLDRRTVLRGAGATLALPLLDAMVPAMSARAVSKLTPKRLGVLYVPNGVILESWTPATTGASYALTPSLAALEPVRDRVQVISGLSLRPADPAPGEALGQHARPSGAFLTGAHIKRTTSSELQAATSLDQLAAQVLGKSTQLSSLEISLEPAEFQACDPGYSCAYSTISWRDAHTPLPFETSPRIVFERLFGDVGSTDAATRRAQRSSEKSLLDSVTAKVATLQRGLGASDKVKLDQYLDSVRSVERRIQAAEREDARELPAVNKPVGTPDSYSDHAHLMFEMQRLAYQSDVTRVITFMIGREQSGKTYPQIGVPDAHHPISHHGGNHELIAKVAKINAYHVSLFAEYLKMLAATPDGEGSLLDQTMLLYGCGMGDGGKHEPRNLPILLAGGGGGTLSRGQHVLYKDEPPLMNLFMSILQKLDARTVDRMGDSTGMLSGI